MMTGMLVVRRSLRIQASPLLRFYASCFAKSKQIHLGSLSTTQLRVSEKYIHREDYSSEIQRMRFV
jgi:hypothetical protein